MDRVHRRRALSVRLFDFLPAFLKDGGLYLLIFALTYILQAAQATSTEIALVFGIYTLSYAAVVPFLGRASDGRGRQRSMLLGAGGFALVAGILSGLIVLEGPSSALRVSLRGPLAGGSVKWLVNVAIAFLALSSALFWPAFQARIGDRERDSESLGRAIRSFNIGWTSGKALGFLVAGILFQAAPSACLPTAAVAGALVFLLVALEQRVIASKASEAAPDGGGDGPRPPDPSARPRAQKLGYLKAGLLANFVLWGTVATLKGQAPKLGEAFALDAQAMGMVLFVALAAQGVCFFLLGGADRWAYRPRTLGLAIPIALAGLGLLYAAGSLPEAALVLAVLGALLIGAAQAVTYAASVFYSLDFDERRGFRTGVHEAVLGAGGALEILGGVAADATGELRAPLVFMAVVGVIATVSVVAILRRAALAHDPGQG